MADKNLTPAQLKEVLGLLKQIKKGYESLDQTIPDPFKNIDASNVEKVVKDLGGAQKVLKDWTLELDKIDDRLDQAGKSAKGLFSTFTNILSEVKNNNEQLNVGKKSIAAFQSIAEKLRDDPDLNYGHSLYENMTKIMNWRHKKFTELDGKPYIDIPMMDWTQYPVKMTGTQAYIVNASYTPSKNSIYINLGYIQKPFVDLDERGIEYNLAHLGFTISHEMSHGFDDFGSQYDEYGRLHDWWTAADKKKFKEIQADVTKQYEEYAARDGIVYDAAIGIGENMADISGMAICNEYLRDFQENNKDLIPIRYLSFEAFYTYYAFQQKQRVGKKALAAQLKTNPHPLDKYRCNVPLSRSEVFRAMFNVKKGDGMWWHNTDTVW
jgi:predicted metalloendopeptidase